MPFSVVQCGWPVGMRVPLRARTGADREAPGRMFIPGGVGDDSDAFTVRQYHHMGRAPRDGRSHL